MHLQRREGGEFSITLQSEGGAPSKRVNFPRRDIRDGSTCEKLGNDCAAGANVWVRAIFFCLFFVCLFTATTSSTPVYLFAKVS